MQWLRDHGSFMAIKTSNTIHPYAVIFFFFSCPQGKPETLMKP